MSDFFVFHSFHQNYLICYLNVVTGFLNDEHWFIEFIYFGILKTLKAAISVG